MNRRLLSKAGIGAALTALIGRGHRVDAAPDESRISPFVDRITTEHRCEACAPDADALRATVHIMSGSWLCDDCAAVLATGLLYVLPNEILPDVLRVVGTYPATSSRSHLFEDVPAQPVRFGWDTYAAYCEGRQRAARSSGPPQARSGRRQRSDRMSVNTKPLSSPPPKSGQPTYQGGKGTPGHPLKHTTVKPTKTPKKGS